MVGEEASMKHPCAAVATFCLLSAVSPVPMAAHRTDFPKTPAAHARIYGVVRDFQGQPVSGADIELMSSSFKEVATTQSAADGSYSLSVEPGVYIALAAVKDYRVSNLEYWAWNVPAFGELEIDPRFDKLEVYAVNAWRPQGGSPSYQIYFRPMSLMKTLAAVIKAGGMEGLGKIPVLDIAPELGAKDIEAKVNGEPVDILQINKVKEAGSTTQALYGYLIQVSIPKSPAAGDWIVFDVTLTDPTTKEKGEARLYLPRPRWR
jgi:hypothetical protein